VRFSVVRGVARGRAGEFRDWAAVTRAELRPPGVSVVAVLRPMEGF
jgi:hypothetical protein